MMPIMLLRPDEREIQKSQENERKGVSKTTGIDRSSMTLPAAVMKHRNTNRVTLFISH